MKKRGIFGMEMWLSENRYQELRYFVKQYDDWKLLYTLLDYRLKSKKIPGGYFGKNFSNRMEEYICERAAVGNNVEMIESVAKECGLTVEDILSEIPDTREFYWRLSQIRK